MKLKFYFWGNTMSNVILDSLLVKGDVYTLNHALSAVSKVAKENPDLAVNDKFIFTGRCDAIYGIFTSVKNGKELPLPTNLLLDSDRFYFPAGEKKPNTTALFITVDALLYPLGSRDVGLRQTVKAGTIFTTYKSVEDKSYYIVQDNTGKSYRVYKNVSRPLVDIEHETKLATNKVSKPEYDTLFNHNSDTKRIEIVRTFSISDQSFTNEEDAEHTAGLIEMLQSYQFKTQTDLESFTTLLNKVQLSAMK